MRAECRGPCGQVKPLEEFKLDRGKRASICKACDAERARLAYARNPRAKQASHRAYYARTRKARLAYQRAYNELHEDKLRQDRREKYRAEHIVFRPIGELVEWPIP